MNNADLLAIATAYPEVRLASGEVLIHEGQPAAALYVLVGGALDVVRNGSAISRLTEPGTVVGEMGLLLESTATADVIAAAPSTVYRIDDAERLFDEQPGFARHLAVVLAKRLTRVTSYLSDLHRQFDDRSGTLGLIPTVLEDLLGTQRPDVDSGSEREPDSPY